LSGGSPTGAINNNMSRISVYLSFNLLVGLNVPRGSVPSLVKLVTFRGHKLPVQGSFCLDVFIFNFNNQTANPQPAKSASDTAAEKKKRNLAGTTRLTWADPCDPCDLAQHTGSGSVEASASFRGGTTRTIRTLRSNARRFTRAPRRRNGTKYLDVCVCVCLRSGEV